MKSRLRPLISPTLCFAIALAACLAQNLSKASLESVWLFDSGHYLQSSQQLADVLRDLRGNLNLTSITMSCWKMKELLLSDGPILPSLGAAVCLLLNKTSALSDARPLIILQAFLHALSASLVCLIARRLSANPKAGLLAGVIWALYPPAVIGAGKFLSETLTTVIALSLLAGLNLLPFRQNRLQPALISAIGLVAGMLTGSIMLTKPALAWSVHLVNIAAVCVLRKGKAVLIASLASGLILVVLPWAAFTKVTTGSPSFSNQRMPTLNVATGLDPETDGWGCLLEAPFVSMFPHNEDAFPTALGIIQSYPGQSLNLTLRKLSRLWCDPWNDFRQKCLFMPIAAQSLWHRALILLGFSGVLFFLAGAGRHAKALQNSNNVSAEEKQSPTGYDVDSDLLTTLANNFLGYASILLITGHLIYLLVVANLRYGFTAMPFLVIFASFAVATTSSVRTARQTAWRTTAALATTILLLMFALSFDFIPLVSALGITIQPARLAEGLLKAVITLCALAAVAHIARTSRTDRLLSLNGKIAIGVFGLSTTAVILANATTDAVITEWQCELTGHAKAERKITLKAQPTRNPAWALLLFDADCNGDTAVVSVNQHRLSNNIRPLYTFTGDKNELGGFQIYSSLLRLPINSFRHWRAIQIPLAELDLNSTNRVTIESSPGSSVGIYGSYQPDPKKMKIPSLTQQSATRLLCSASNTDVRLIDLRSIDTSEAQSSMTDANEKPRNDLSPALGTQLGQYHILIALGYRSERTALKGALSTVLPAQQKISVENSYQSSSYQSSTSPAGALTSTMKQAEPAPDFRNHVLKVF